MEIIETPTFTEQITDLLDDEEYGKLQYALCANAELGVLIPGAGGLRKMRWSHPSRRRGKRGGIRVIYYSFIRERIYMFFAYDKNQQGDLSRDQVGYLREYVKKGVL